MSEAKTDVNNMTIERKEEKIGTEQKKDKKLLKQPIRANTPSSSTVALNNAQASDLSSDQLRNDAIGNFMHPENKLKPVKKKNFFVRNLGLTLTAAALAFSAAGYGIYESIKKSNEPVPVPEFFDPSALKSVIGPNDSIQIPASEYFASAPTIWNEQSRIMTIPVPVLFRDGRLPTLTVDKIPSALDGKLDTISIDGLEQGDVILSPMDGRIEVNQPHEDFAVFFFESTDTQGRGISIMFLGPPLEPLITLDQPISKTGSFYDIKKGQPIGKILASDKDLLHRYKISLIGGGPAREGFNLTVTSEGKAPILTEEIK